MLLNPCLVEIVIAFDDDAGLRIIILPLLSFRYLYNLRNISRFLIQKTAFTLNVSGTIGHQLLINRSQFGTAPTSKLSCLLPLWLCVISSECQSRIIIKLIIAPRLVLLLRVSTITLPREVRSVRIHVLVFFPLDLGHVQATAGHEGLSEWVLVAHHVLG